MGFSRDANGWSIAMPSGSPVDGFVGNPGSGDTRVIHVSDSTGYDADGTGSTQGNGSRAKPYKTIAKGQSRMRQGSPDQLLLANGDRFGDQSFLVGQIAGASPTARMVWSSYDRSENFPSTPNPGTSTPQPLLLIPLGANGVGFLGENSAVMGIDFYSYTRDPDNPAFNPSNPNLQETTGFWLTGNAQTIEDCCWRFFHSGGEVGGGGNQGGAVGDSGKTQEIRRCRIVDNHNLNDKVSVGVGGGGYGQHLLIEHNFLDRNGYHPTYNPEGSSLNHNLYINANNSNDPLWGEAPGNVGNNFWLFLELHGNVIARDGPHADCQLRCGGYSHNNLWFINGTSGANYGMTNAFANNLIENDVSFDCTGYPGRAQCLYGLGGTGSDAHPGYWGYNIPGMRKMTIRNVICLKPTGTGLEAAPFAVGGIGPVIYTIINTISYKFAANDYVRPGGSIVDDRFGGAGTYEYTGYNYVTNTPRAEWPFPNRTTGTYLDHILGGSGHTNDDYYNLCRQQRKGNWNPLLMPESVNDYVREGFGVEPVGSAYAGGGTIATGIITVRDVAGTTASVPVTLNISAP